MTLMTHKGIFYWRALSLYRARLTALCLGFCAQTARPKSTGRSALENNYLRRDIGLAERDTAQNPYRHWPLL